MGQTCVHLFGERPIGVNDDINGEAGAARANQRMGLFSDTTIDDDGKDGYSQGAMNNMAGMKRADPNYRSQEIGIEDFQIIKVIGRGSFGKVYLV